MMDKRLIYTVIKDELNGYDYYNDQIYGYPVAAFLTKEQAEDKKKALEIEELSKDNRCPSNCDNWITDTKQRVRYRFRIESVYLYR